MKREIIVLLLVCGFAAARVLRQRRAVDTEKQTTSVKICAKTVPCAWSVYKQYLKTVDFFIANTYCHCSADTTCIAIEDDETASAYIHRCRAPSEVNPDDVITLNPSP